ncbi:MAG: uroporphyrinogen-III C-methyltransferase [Pseudomonadota bacterium]
MSGFVSFVSAGPGDPELLTLKAVDRLQRADAVLFDDLASGPVLKHARRDADLVGVGKRAGQVSPKQAHVSRLLVDYAQAGGRIVRLKSGDAGLFGRLEEELIALGDAGIRYEIIPGVPTPCAAAAASGIPLTRRLEARRVQFITGADIAGGVPDDLNIAALADPRVTTVVFMGRRTFPELAKQLIAAGLPADTPALAAEAVTQPEENMTRGTVASLAQMLATSASRLPTLILLGPLAEPPPARPPPPDGTVTS